MLLECAANSGLFKIEVAADNDAELAQKTGRNTLQHYDDYRMAVMQSGLDAVFFAAPLHACAEYIRAALNKKMHVLRIAPPARTFDELAEFVRQADLAGVTFGPALNASLQQDVCGLARASGAEPCRKHSSVTAHCGAARPGEPWRRDPKLAGGGFSFTAAMS